ncbi:MAG: hypothetical protein A2017_14025 [Lentisphaerae bacterium GWF2_44_16]|nr:MAG: hypothetical protein A2017_14025 [Lentisphaerae bacterium GWF2_44_16]
MTYFIAGLAVLSLVFTIIFKIKSSKDLSAGAKMYILLFLFVISVISLFFKQNATLAFCSMMMIYSFIGMLYCAKKQKLYANAQNVAIVLFVIVIFCGGTVLTLTMGSGDSEKLIANEMKFAKAASIVMGRELAEKYPDSKALIIVDRNFEKNKRQKEMVDGLKDGFGSKVSIAATDFVDIPRPVREKKEEENSGENKDKGAEKGTEQSQPPPPPPEDEFDMMPVSERACAEHFDALINKYPDCNLVVTLVGLPYDVGEMSIWSRDPEKRPKMALLFADVFKLKNAIKADYITALTYKPGVKFSEDPAPSDPQKAFEQRYIILNKDNVDSVDKNVFQQ